jgi:hypothetical protein
MSLVSLADLLAPSVTAPAKSNGVLAVERMKDAASPMPPTGLLPAATIATLEAWVTSGMPAGSCDPGAADPFAAPPVCTSNRTWTRGDDGSSSMHPGYACIDCHDQWGGPSFSIAGTVFPTAHEPDDCYGGPSGIEIDITDATGRVIPLYANRAGNFFSGTSIALPYTAKVISGGSVRAMSASQTTGDCNSCHTQDGANGAPGRILAP